jgi:hypothetical protein
MLLGMSESGEWIQVAQYCLFIPPVKEVAVANTTLIDPTNKVTIYTVAELIVRDVLLE